MVGEVKREEWKRWMEEEDERAGRGRGNGISWKVREIIPMKWDGAPGGFWSFLGRGCGSLRLWELLPERVFSPAELLGQPCLLVVTFLIIT